MRILWLRNTVELNQFTGGKQMKKLTVIAVAVAAIMLFAIPAMALDADFGGAYRVRGFYMDNSDLDDDVGASDAFMDMRLRLGADFKVTDNLKLTIGLDALDDKVWGQNQAVAGQATTGSNLSFDKCYITAKFGIGELIIGRFTTGDFGTLFLDSGEEHKGDQIEWHLPEMEGIDLYLFYEKITEADKDAASPPGVQVSDQDVDDYGIGVVYKAEGVDAGIEITYMNDKSAPATDVQAYMWNPYVVAKLGPVNLEGELGYVHGDVDKTALAVDQDIKMLAYNVAVSGDAGPVNVGVGYAFSSGDEDGWGTGDIEAMPFAEDWQPLLILTGYTNDTTLGQVGNLNGNNSANTSQLGFKVIYVTASFAPTENVTLSFIGAQAEADETGAYGANIDDEVGYEYDLGVTVKLMDNLTYNATIGFLDAGDIWSDVDDQDDTYTFLHSLVFSF